MSARICKNQPSHGLKKHIKFFNRIFPIASEISGMEPWRPSFKVQVLRFFGIATPTVLERIHSVKNLKTSVVMIK